MKKGLLTGLLLFGFFFGAGNLIFPPTLGYQSADQLWPAVIGFIVSGVGLAIGTLLIGTVINGGFKKELDEKIHPIFSLAYLIALYLAIGPFFAIPRTATVSYNIGVAPFLPDSKSGLIIYAAIYFAVAFYLAYNRSSLLSSIGKILTPIFAGLILILVVVGAFKFGQTTPELAGQTELTAAKAFGNGFIEGYNTLDALAAVAFSVVAVNTLKEFHFSSKKEYEKTIMSVGVVTAIGFSVLYIGLAFLGNHFNVASALAKDADLNVGSYVLTMASRELFGTFGQAFLAMMVVITCLTTTVGLIVSVGEFFEETFPRFSYKVYATVFTLIGFGVATLGLQTIIAFSLPVLMILYPITVVIAFFVLVNKKVAFSKRGMQLTVALTTIISTVSSLASALKLEGLAKALEILPLQGLSLGWMGPAIVGILIALLLPDKIKGEAFDFEAFQTK